MGRDHVSSSIDLSGWLWQLNCGSRHWRDPSGDGNTVRPSRTRNGDLRLNQTPHLQAGRSYINAIAPSPGLTGIIGRRNHRAH